MRKILSCARKYILYILLAPVCVMCEVYLESKIPLIMADVINTGIYSGDVKTVLNLGLRMILTALLTMTMGIVSNYFSSKGGIGFGTELRKTVFRKIQEFSFENIDKFQQSSLLTRLTTDVNNIQSGMMQMTRMFIRSPFMFVVATTTALSINRNLFDIFLVAMPILLVIMVIFMLFSSKLFRAMLEMMDALNQRLRENLINIREVKAYVREDHERKLFKKTNDDLLTISLKVDTAISMAMPIMTLDISLCIVAVYWIGGKLVVFGDMEIGDLIAFVSYVGQILMSLMMLSMIFMSIIRIKGSIERISEVLNEEVRIADGDYDGEVEEGSVEFRDTCFEYPSNSKDIIWNISLKINAGETIGVIGSTGSGKTSLVQMIPRLYDCTSGSVLVGGRNVKEYKIKKLRDSVAMVLQQNVLFSGKIIDNLRWGKEDATEEEIIKACKCAQAHDFITSFPDGYDTVLGQGGVNVSGGQKQRLCIARALIKKPKIIILDDSTSAVDTKTDALIREALATELKGTTTFIIAQRVSSVMSADKVIVLNNGALDAFDTPENLLKNNEIYQDIYYTQLKGVEEDAA
ncbi:MAG: ABC transporter ATP-binding protein [Erysipelotrichaceae bacterium]|nr:ABC transporter ATP-binding protein [Erysipelotrichaceae bacterium]